MEKRLPGWVDRRRPVGSNYSHIGLDQLRRVRPLCSPVALSFLYQLLRRMLGLERALREFVEHYNHEREGCNLSIRQL